MILPSLNDLSVSRVHVHGVGLDALNTRQGIERLLGAVQSHTDLGPSTILCIRHMAMRVTAGAARPHQQVSAAPTRRLADTLDTLARAAARPALGPVPSDAQAVRFADRAELLACLVQDWLAGTAPGCWWWRDLLGSHNAAEAVRLACLASPDFVPPLFERLARQGNLKRFVQALPPASARDLLTAVLQAHDLNDFDAGGVHPAIAPPVAEPLQHLLNQTSTDGTEARPLSAPYAAAEPSGLAPPVWVTRCIPLTLFAGLSGGQRALVVLSLALMRAPGELRGATTRASLAAWLHQTPHTVPGQAQVPGQDAPKAHAWLAHPVPTTQPVDASLVWPDPEDKRAGPYSTCPTTPQSERLSSSSVANIGPTPQAATPVDTTHCVADLLAPPKWPHTQEPGTTDTNEHPLKQPPAHQHEPARPQRGADTTTPHAPLQPLLLSPYPSDGTSTLHTHFGGLFYLVNAALALGLYNDFTKPAEPGIGLPVWDFLALAGQHLAGPARQALLADPAWSLLASLSARQPDEAPGAHFEPPDDWQIPLSWLAPFADQCGAWQWQADESRLLVHHPAGFTVVDARRDARDAPRQAQGAVHPYRAGHRFQLRSATTTPACPLTSEPASGVHLARWCNWVMPYLTLRLAQALRIKPPMQVGPMLMHQPARLALSAARLDVYLPLAQLPVAVRMAGLDRNPGWVPAAGRTLAFHYE